MYPDTYVVTKYLVAKFTSTKFSSRSIHISTAVYMLHPASTQIQCAHWTCLCPVSTLDSPVYTLDINMSSVHTGINADAQ